jgi:hypothetical protein
LVNPSLIAFSWSNTPESILFFCMVLRATLLKRKAFLVSCIVCSNMFISYLTILHRLYKTFHHRTVGSLLHTFLRSLLLPASLPMPAILLSLLGLLLLENLFLCSYLFPRIIPIGCPYISLPVPPLSHSHQHTLSL